MVILFLKEISILTETWLASCKHPCADLFLIYCLVSKNGSNIDFLNSASGMTQV